MKEFVNIRGIEVYVLTHIDSSDENVDPNVFVKYEDAVKKMVKQVKQHAKNHEVDSIDITINEEKGYAWIFSKQTSCTWSIKKLQIQ